MKKNITPIEAEKRMAIAWNWFWKTEPKACDGSKNPRWETFRRIRDRLRPYRLPLSVRLEAALCGISGGLHDKKTGRCRLSVSALNTIDANI